MRIAICDDEQFFIEHFTKNNNRLLCTSWYDV